MDDHCYECGSVFENPDNARPAVDDDGNTVGFVCENCWVITDKWLKSIGFNRLGVGKWSYRGRGSAIITFEFYEDGNLLGVLHKDHIGQFDMRTVLSNYPSRHDVVDLIAMGERSQLAPYWAR